MAAAAFGEGRRGTNIRHQLGGLLRQAVYGRLAGYEDVNDAGHFADDPAMRAIVGREGMDRPAASTSQMGRFETEWLATEANLAALADRRLLPQGAEAKVPLCRGVSAHGGERPRKRYRGRRRGPRLTPAPILARHITRRRPPAPSAPAPSR